MRNKLKKNLIVCITPLQMLIAKKIIALHPESSFDFLCLYYDDNSKYEYYYHELKKVCNKSERFLIKNENIFLRIFMFLKFFLFLRKNFETQYNSIFISSIDSFLVHFLCSKIAYKNIKTFDDGIANIHQDGIYFCRKKISLGRKFFLKIFRINHDKELLIEKTETHYTIFKDIVNVTSRTFFLEMAENNNKGELRKEINIFLGQPFKEYKLSTEINIVSILKNLKIDQYYPHPREKEINLNIKIVKSNLIIEDYVLELIKSGFKVRVYAFLSTALINMQSIKGVEVYLIHNNELYKKYKSLYDVFEKAHIPVIYL
ncbi:hypothetical protein ACEPLI_002276 [Acinetobacter baumannii]